MALFLIGNEIKDSELQKWLLKYENLDEEIVKLELSFKDNGEIIFATHLKQDIKDFISNYSLDNRFINAKRLEYLEYHRNEVFEKRYKYA